MSSAVGYFSVGSDRLKKNIAFERVRVKRHVIVPHETAPQLKSFSSIDSSVHTVRAGLPKIHLHLALTADYLISGRGVGMSREITGREGSLLTSIRRSSGSRFVKKTLFEAGYGINKAAAYVGQHIKQTLS